MVNKLFLIIVICFPLTVLSQSSDYNDVALIINDNSQTSINIGNYFAQERAIPSLNIIHISAPVIEEIDSVEFEQIRVQIESYLTVNNLSDSINYIVTTKGVPLKVKRGNCINPSSNTSCASFDSELSLILGPYSNSIGMPWLVSNPYKNSSTHFSKGAYGIYLVTRLDAYTEQEVITIIDRSGPLTVVNKASAQIILDVSNSLTAAEQAAFIAYYQPANDNLTNDGWSVNFHTNDSLLTNQSNVFGYASTNRNSAGVVLNNSWTKGSISSIFYSFSAQTFDTAVNINNDLIIANLISEGASAAHGHVYYTYASYGLRTEILFSHYLDSSANYNLAESYYMADPTLSWQSVVIGDPKASVVIDNSVSLDQTYSESFNLYPNPSKGSTIITAKNITQVEVYNLNGVLVKRHKSYPINKLDVNLRSIPDGVYFLRVVSDNKVYQRKLVHSKNQ